MKNKMHYPNGRYKTFCGLLLNDYREINFTSNKREVTCKKCKKMLIMLNDNSFSFDTKGN